MNQLEKYDELVKALLAIATYKISVDDLEEDLDAIQQEANRALRVAGYDFETLMKPKNSTSPNMEA